MESAGVARGKSPRLVLWVVGSCPFSSLEQSGFPAIKGGVQHSGLVALPLPRAFLRVPPQDLHPTPTPNSCPFLPHYLLAPRVHTACAAVLGCDLAGPLPCLPSADCSEVFPPSHRPVGHAPVLAPLPSLTRCLWSPPITFCSLPPPPPTLATMFLSPRGGYLGLTPLFPVPSLLLIPLAVSPEPLPGGAPLHDCQGPAVLSLAPSSATCPLPPLGTAHVRS